LDPFYASVSGDKRAPQNEPLNTHGCLVTSGWPQPTRVLIITS